MADENYSEEQPPLVYDFVPPKGKLRRQEYQPINRKIPEIMYDDRSTYRGDYNGGKEQYAEDLPWRADSYKPTETGARGIIPGFYGTKYTDPYSRLDLGPTQGYQWAGSERKKAELAEQVAAQRAHDKAIPKPTMSMPDDPYEKFTSYREQFCQPTEKEDTMGNKLPDIRPMNKGTFKYHQNAKFSYNSRQNNMAY